MAKPSKFAHVVYSTRRFDEMIDWYQKVFEAKVVHQDPMLAFLTYDDEHHRFAFINMSAFKPDGAEAGGRAETGVNHVAYTYANPGDLLDTYARLKQSGITPYWPIHHGMTLSFYYQDPDGNRMEFQVDCCTSEEAKAYMLSDAFAANPIGVDVDPEALLAQYRSGVPVEKLLVMPQGQMSQIPVEHGLS
ncbi:MAG: VOC family protein [Acidobacteria bacterium]|nr:VOC family protein [Acidobacteriota bacterium]MBK9706144.1 VOC family protein [Acidobacteriota bacterium]